MQTPTLQLGIQKAFRNAVEDILSEISGILIDLVRAFVNDVLLELITKSPVPSSNKNMPPLNTPPQSCGSGAAAECSMWSELYHNVYTQEVLWASIAIFVLSFVVTKGMEILGDENVQEKLGNFDVNEKFGKVILGIALWWQIGTLVLWFAQQLTTTLAGCEGSSCSFAAEMSLAGGGEFATVIGLLLLYGLGSTLILAVVAFWVLRYIVLVSLMIVMPVLLSLSTMRIGPLSKIADTADDFISFFVTLAFAPIPAGLILFLGAQASSITGAMLTSINLGGPDAAVNLTPLVNGIVFISVPIIAGIVPVLMFKDKASDALGGYAGGVVGGSFDKVFDKLEPEDEFDSIRGQVFGRNKQKADERYSGDYDTIGERAREGARGEYDSVHERARETGRETYSSVGSAVRDTGVRAGQAAAVGGASLYHRDAVADAVKQQVSEKTDAAKEYDYKGNAVNAAVSAGGKAKGAAGSAADSAKSAAYTPYDRANQAYAGVQSQVSTIKDTEEDTVRDMWTVGEEVTNTMGDAVSAHEAMFNRGTKAGVTAGDIRDTLGTEEEKKIHSEAMLSAVKSNSTDDAYRTMLGSLTDTPRSELKNMDESELEEKVESELGEEYVSGVEELEKISDRKGGMETGVSHGDDISFNVLDGIGQMDESEDKSSVGQSLDRAIGFNPATSESGETVINTESGETMEVGVESDSSNYIRSMRTMAALANTDQSDVNDPVLKKAIEKLDESEHVGKYGEELAELTEENIENVFGIDETGKLNRGDKFLNAIKNDSKEEAYEVILERLTNVDTDGIEDDEDVRDIVKSELGESYVNGVESLKQQAEWDGNNIFDEFGLGEEQIREEVYDEIDESEIALEDEFNESVSSLKHGNVGEAEEKLARAMVGEDALEEQLQGIAEDVGREEALNTAGKLYENIQKNQMKEAGKLIAEAQNMDTSSMSNKKLESLADDIVDSASSDIKEEHSEQLEKLSEKFDEPLDEGAIESLAEQELSESLSGNTEVKEEFEDIVQTIADSQHTETAKKTLKMMSEIDPENTDDPDLKSAATRFESLDKDFEEMLDSDDIDDINASELQEELSSMSDDERASVARAISGGSSDSNLSNALDRLAVSDSWGETRYEDTTDNAENPD